MIRIDVTHATRAIVKSANLGVALFLLVFVAQIFGASAWVLYARKVAPGTPGAPAGAVDALIHLAPLTVLLYLVYSALYYLVCVRRAVVVTELTALAYSFGLVSAVTVLPLAILVQVFRTDQDAVDTVTVVGSLVQLAGIIWIGLPYILAAHRFRKLRRRLRAEGVDLSFRPWLKRSFRAQMRVVSRWRVGLSVTLFITGAVALQGVAAGLGLNVGGWIGPAAASLSAFVAAIVLLALSHRTLLGARRRAMRRLGEMQADDRRAPVLFLRSFNDDSLRARPRRRPALWPLARRRLGSEGSFEEVLTIALADTGPVVAIGRPGETIVPVGAAREYVADDAWQARIHHLIAEAALVIILVGATPGLAWEVVHLLAPEVRSRVLFVVPPVEAAEAARRWAALRHHIAAAGADAAGLPDEVTGALLFSVGDGAAVEPRLYIASDRTLEHYEMAIVLGSRERLAGPLSPLLLRLF